MLLVETYIALSEIHGMGLFAGRDIKAGTVTWRFSPAIDLLISQDQISLLPQLVRDFISEYGSLSKLTGMIVLSADNARFTNHNSENPNLDSKVVEGEPEAIALANRDITKGEELTIDYRRFDLLSETSESDYLK